MEVTVVNQMYVTAMIQGTLVTTVKHVCEVLYGNNNCERNTSSSLCYVKHVRILSLQQHYVYIHVQVIKKLCELKGGNIGIVEKAQETRFGMSQKYSRYIGIAS